MAPAFPWRKCAWIGGILFTGWTVFMALLWLHDLRRWPLTDTATHVQPPLEKTSDSFALTGTMWSAFRAIAATNAPLEEAGQAVRRYRLAGTFNVEAEDGKNVRRAIVDDLATRAQHIVSAGDVIGDAIVERIDADRVWLRRQDHLEEIALRFRDRSLTDDGMASGDKTLAETPGVPRRFSQQVDEYRWTCNREALLQYYEELFDAPERLAAVFDSLKPLYDDERRITGYVLGVEGEKEFFDEVGLREGDIVRKVNSMPMTSRRRAEYFINEFVRNNLSAFVLEIERDGVPLKLIYEVR